MLGIHYPCSRAVNTGVQNETRLHEPYSGTVNTGRVYQAVKPKCESGLSATRVTAVWEIPGSIQHREGDTAIHTGNTLDNTINQSIN